MKAVNNYYLRQLTAEEINAGEHRSFVGGLWDEIGALQFDFLKQQGLLPEHKLLDIGCGALRCGIPIIEYLDPGNYHGIDLNASLIEAGKYELDRKDLSVKHPHLLVNDKFEFDRFEQSFDFAIAQSVFTHLDMNLIRQCLAHTAKVLKPLGQCFATFFLAPSELHLEPIKHIPGGVVTNFGSDPFHYSFSEISSLAEASGLSAKLIGNWDHPRGQQMVELRVSPRPAASLRSGRR